MTQKNKQIQQISEIRKSPKSVIQTKAHGGELKVETKPARAGTDGEGEGTTYYPITCFLNHGFK